jgi:acyl-lipid omega-6 desaturase (Delta-12 desaturase)
MRPFTPSCPTAQEVRSRLTASSRRPTTGTGIVVFGSCVSCYLALLLASLACPWWPAQLLAALLNGWLIFVLLCVGHDAAHGTLTSSRLLNNLIGRLAFLPSLTPYSIWAYTHNRLHHGFTNLRGYDPAFAPFSQEEFARLPTWRRILERCYKTVPGLALYYLVAIWWKYVFAYPGPRSNRRVRPLFVLDRLLVVCFVGVQAVTVLACQALVTPGGSESLLSAWARLLVGLVLPWLTFCWITGFVSFLHHTHPKVRWYGNRSEWRFYGGQVQGSVHVVFPWPLGWLMHAIMEHPAHHTDCRIPTMHLRDCQQQLAQAYPEVLVERFSVTYLRRLLATCQLYDYDSHRWLDFAGNPAPEEPCVLAEPAAGATRGR